MSVIIYLQGFHREAFSPGLPRFSISLQDQL